MRATVNHIHVYYSMDTAKWNKNFYMLEMYVIILCFGII